MLHQSCIISILITQKSKGLMKWNQKTHVEPISLHRCLGISLCPGDARRASLRAADFNFSGPPKSPLISSNYETRIAVYKDWYLILSYIYILYNIIIDIDHPKIQWNILKQLHSHLGGETYEDFHAPNPPPRNHQTTTHSEPKRNVTHRLSDMSCNMEWRSWCSSWRLAIQANKVMPTKSAKFMGTLKIPGGQKPPPPQGNSEHRKKGPHFEPPQKKALHLLDFRALHRRHSRECLVKRQKVYIYIWQNDDQGWIDVPHDVASMSICINFLDMCYVLKTNLKLLIISWHSLSKSCFSPMEMNHRIRCNVGANVLSTGHNDSHPECRCLQSRMGSNNTSERSWRSVTLRRLAAVSKSSR